jgi:ribosomal protein S18 acetylase RimI-like enzyme
MNPHVDIVHADLDLPDHQVAVCSLTAAYALDPMGNGAPLSADTMSRLIAGLQSTPTTLILLAFVGERAVGIATCFRGFSTFLARPLINIHDFAVLGEFRGQGIARQLLEAVTEHARASGCGRVTLEVQQNNSRARRVYEQCGFAHAVYGETTGGSLFYIKAL